MGDDFEVMSLSNLRDTFRCFQAEIEKLRAERDALRKRLVVDEAMVERAKIALDVWPADEMDGCHYDIAHPLRSQTLGDILLEAGVLSKPFYQTPPGGELTIPHEPLRMTIERLADYYKAQQGPPWTAYEWKIWGRHRSEMV